MAAMMFNARCRVLTQIAICTACLTLTYLSTASRNRALRSEDELREQLRIANIRISSLEEQDVYQATPTVADHLVTEGTRCLAGSEVREYTSEELLDALFSRQLTDPAEADCCSCDNITLPTTTTTTAVHWRILNGTGCEMQSEDCITTANYPSHYPESTYCTIKVTENPTLFISVEDWSVETGYNLDYMIVDGPGGQHYHGSDSPPSPWLPRAGVEITWTNDALVTERGWRLCLRASCEGYTCPSQYKLKDGAAAHYACGGRECTDDDVGACCTRECDWPQNVSDDLTVPEGCVPGSSYSVRECTLGCAGETELDGYSPPQTCQDDGVFTMPTCKAQMEAEFPWIIRGDCQRYGSGCVSSVAVGGKYNPDEVCLISYEMSPELDPSQFTYVFTYLDTQADVDKLVAGAEPCESSTQHDWCTEFHPNVGAYGFPDGQTRSHSGNYGVGVRGPYSMFEHLLWTSDGDFSGGGWIVCAQALCQTMSCPTGYRFNCDSDVVSCGSHDCSLADDVDTCCLPETQQDADLYGFTVGEADNITWCYSTTTTTTTTSTWGAKPDIVGYLILVLEPGNNTQADIKELIHNALASAGNVGYWDVQVNLNMTFPNTSAISHVVFHVEQTDVQLELFTAEEYMNVINNMTLPNPILDDLVQDVEHRVVASTLTNQRDHRNFRQYGTNCQDLYSCDGTADCWRDWLWDASCGRMNEQKWCHTITSPGPGYPPSSSSLRNYGNWLPQWSDADWSLPFGREMAHEVCCTCGGGACTSGSFRIFNAMPTFCIPCQAGTSTVGPDAEPNADPQECSACDTGRFAPVQGAACAGCPAGQYTDEVGSTSCTSCDPGSVTTEVGRSNCDACPPGTESNDELDECIPCTPGNFAGSNFTSECEACPLGTFSRSNGATECILCSEGSFAGSPGRTACDPCNAGEYSDELGLSACHKCSPGEAQSMDGSTVCIECEIGYFARKEGESECLLCEEGTESTEEGASECARCDPGYAKAAGALNCSICAPGDYSAEPGLTACRTCNIGEHANAPEGATGCLECTPGTYGPESGLTSCIDCELGFYSGEEKQSACTECAVGEFVNQTGLSQSFQCAPGSFTSVTGRAFCELCSPGHDAPAWASVQCEVCDAGRKAPAEGTPLCLECVPGWYSPLLGSTACVICAPGRFAGTPGKSECPFCDYGTFAEELGMTKCTGCNETLPGVSEFWTTMRPPTDEEPARGSGIKPWRSLLGAVNRTSCGCRPGTQPRDGVCEECGEGLICLGMGVLEIEDGYAWDGAFSTWDCDHGIEDACPGGVPGRCMPGRDEEAVACAICLPEMVPADDGSCDKCKDTDYLIPSLAVILSIVIATCCYLLFDSPKRKRPKLSFLLIVASLGQAVTIIQQLGIVSLIRVDWSNPLLSVFEFISSVIFFDVQVLRPGCLTSMDVVRMYLVRVLFVFICLGIVCFAHVVSQLLQHRNDWRTRWPTLWCALGTILLTFFVSILSTMLGPLQCRTHPNGRQTISWYPSVVCWEGGDHFSMIVIGSFACTLPLIFLALSAWAVRNYPRSLLQADTRFLNTWAFLFFRYNPEAYWYGPIMMVRNGLVSAAPVLTSSVLQILCLEVVMLLSLMLLLFIMPWRITKANYLDAVGHFCLLMVTMMASFYVDGDDIEFVSTLAVCFISALPVCLLVALFYGITLLMSTMRRPYQFFLCHHKLGAGCLARLLKMWLVRTSGVTRKVFIDSDDLKNLDKLFEIVAHQTETLVAITSQNLLQRPWCVGEIATAHRSRIRAIPIYVAGVGPPTADFIDRFLEYVPDISCLTQYTIDFAMVQDALIWFASVNSCTLPQEIQDGTMEELCSGLVSTKLPESFMAVAPVKNLTPKEVIIIANKTDFEAAATAMILRNLLNPIIQHKENSLASVLATGEVVSPSVKKGMLICTNGVFTGLVLQALLTCKARAAIVLPIMSVTNFIFPSEAWIDEQPVFAKLNFTEREKAIAVVQAIFSEIAVDFQPSALSGTEATLHTKANEVAHRIFSGMSSLSDKVLELDRKSRNKHSSPTVSTRLIEETSTTDKIGNTVSKITTAQSRDSRESGSAVASAASVPSAIASAGSIPSVPVEIIPADVELGSDSITAVGSDPIRWAPSEDTKRESGRTSPSIRTASKETGDVVFKIPDGMQIVFDEEDGDDWC